MSLNTGFNPEKVYESLKGVQNAYNDLCDAIGPRLQTKFVNYMSENWACDEAQKFFKKAETKVNVDLRKEIDKIFLSVNESMNAAGARWAADTGNSGVFSKVAFAISGARISSDVIKENIAGVRGINVGCDGEASSRLSATVQDADKALNDAIRAVASAGFLGGGQQAALSASLNKIKTNITNESNDLKNALKESISATTGKFTSTASTITDAFTGK